MLQLKALLQKTQKAQKVQNEIRIKAASYLLSQRLGITCNAAYYRIRRLWRRGKIKGVKIGKELLLDEDSFIIFLQGETPPLTPI